MRSANLTMISARALVVLLTLAAGSVVRAAEIVWLLDNIGKIGGHVVTVAGAPRVEAVAGEKAVVFDGVKDGIFVPAIPFAGAKHYTIEILFQPREGGPSAQRFLHAQDAAEHRALIETRLDGKGGWWLDTYILTGAPASGVTLIDPARVHPTGQWYWAALRYDGKIMAHFVNGRKELERAATFEPFGAGQTSLGVRQNRVYWFKGAIREVRFHTEAVPDEKLQRVK
jgi:hypothetical protein